jgi:hypothetical protein
MCFYDNKYNRDEADSHGDSQVSTHQKKNSISSVYLYEGTIHCLDSSIIKIFIFFLSHKNYLHSHSANSDEVALVSQRRSKPCSLVPAVLASSYYPDRFK